MSMGLDFGSVAREGGPTKRAPTHTASLKAFLPNTCAAWDRSTDICVSMGEVDMTSKGV